jgi:hypothetical protein
MKRTHITSQEIDEIVREIFRNIRDKNEKNVIQYIYSYADIRDDNRKLSIFEIINIKRNNILMECCEKKLVYAAAIIIKKYNSEFNISLINFEGKNALMICIDNNIYNVALLLLNYPESLTDLFTECICVRKSALDSIIKKSCKIMEEITILVKILDYYIMYDSNSQIFHRNINLICQNKELVPFVQPYFKKSVLDFDKLCIAPVKAEVSIFVNIYKKIHYNTRSSSKGYKVKAKPYHIQVAEPI